MQAYSFFIKVLVFSWVVLIFSCRKLIEIPSSTSEVNSATVFTSDENAFSALRGVYSEMSSNGAFSGKMFLLGGLSADEFYNHELLDIQYKQFADMSLDPNNGYLSTALWNPCYKYIYFANSIIEGLDKSTAITASTKAQIEGEAKFIRAICFFYLQNFFGNIPLPLSTDYRVNNRLSRSGTETVYNQIIVDLTDAKNLLPESYPGTERIRPNKSAAVSMLARVYLYREDWANAELNASEVIDQPAYYLETNPDDVFIKSSKEAIWQLKPVDGYRNTWEGSVLIVTETPEVVYNSEELMTAFEDSDLRKSKWTSNVNGFDFSYKYKIKNGFDPLDEYSVVIRLAELYLIRAEARARQDNLAGAIEDVDRIRGRAALPLIADINPGIEKNSLLDKILHERQVELFAEWSHRWFDLKRTGKAGEVLSLVKRGFWQETDKLYPIPQIEKNNNENLGQNEGYPQ